MSYHGKITSKDGVSSASFAEEDTLNKIDFVPPAPRRLPDNKPFLLCMLHARDNLLAGWKKKDFFEDTFEFNLGLKHYVVCNSPKTVRYAFLEKHESYDPKSPQMVNALEPLLGDGLFVSDGELWAERREACAPSMRNNLLPSFAPIMIDTSADMVEHWADHWAQNPDEPIDVLHEMGKLTATIIGKTIFGDDLPEEEAAQVVQGFAEYQIAIDQLDLASTVGVPFLKFLKNPIKDAQGRRAAQDVQDVIDHIIARHKAGDRDKQSTTSLLSLFLDAETGHGAAGEGAKSCPMSSEAARNEAIVMFMAGHETTANTLAWAWYLLDASPRVRKALDRELESVLEGRTPSLDDLPNLPYTRAVIEETLRLYPPVPVLSRTARHADTIEDIDVAPGDILLVVPWLLHRHEYHWDKPTAFRPERFLPGQPKANKFVYLPFSVGPRVCLGQRFALTESILCLATLAQRFAPKLAEGATGEIACRLTLRPKDGMPMIMQPAGTPDKN